MEPKQDIVKKKGTMFVQEKAELAFRVGFVSAPTSNLV
jgi:hypothetical protein